MAYELTPVAEQLKQTPQMSMADMVNVGRGVQGYQSGQIALEQQDVANKEQQAVAGAMKANPGLLMTDNRLDLDKINTIIPQLAPRTQDLYLQKYSTLHGAQTQALEAKRGFSQAIKSNIGGFTRILGEAGIEDPKAVLSMFEQLKTQYADQPDVKRYLDAAAVPFKMIPPGAHVSQMLIRGAQSLLTPQEQETTFGPKPGTMNLNRDIVQMSTKATPGGLPAKITMGPTLQQMQVGPSEAMVPNGRVDMNNNPLAWVKDKNGNILGEVTISGGAQLPTGFQPPPVVQPPPPGPTQPVAPQTPSTARPLEAPVYANAPVRLPAGENPTTLDAATALRLQARQLAQTAPQQQFNSNQIIKLADDVITGKGAATLANLTGGYAAIPFTSDNASNLQQLGHYMALQTQQLSSGTGLGGTDAGRAIAGQMAGTTEWTAPAIKSTARVNRALSTGSELFSQGVENAFERTKNPFAAVEFQNRWSQALGNEGINAIRLYDAIKNKDQDAIKEVVTQAGGQNSVGYKTLITKIQDMQKLIGGK